MAEHGDFKSAAASRHGRRRIVPEGAMRATRCYMGSGNGRILDRATRHISFIFRQFGMADSG